MPVTRTLVATGGSSGLGFEAIRQLLTTAPEDITYTVILGCRNIQATEQAYKEADLPPRHDLRFLPLELSELKSARRFSEAVLEEMNGKQLDELLLCAAISKAASEQDQKVGQWTQAFIVNYAAQQYILFLLEERLRQSKTKIVVVTSMLYKKVEDSAQLQAIVGSSSSASALEVYRSTKFIQLASLQRWRDRLDGSCKIVAVSPGFVPTTGLSRETGYLAGLFMKYILPWAPFATSLHDGGQAICRALSDSFVIPADISEKSVLSKTGEWEVLNEKVTDPAVIENWWLSKEDVEVMQDK